MASNTPNLNLYKKDPVADGADVFNIETMLNQNWEKIDEAFGNFDVEVIDSVTSTDKTKPASANAVKTAYDKAAGKQDPVKLANDFKGPDALISAFPEGYSVFYVGGGASGQGAAWRAAAGAEVNAGFVETIRVGNTGYQIFTEMYLGTASDNVSSNKQYKRIKRDSNSFWQPFDRILDSDDLKLAETAAKKYVDDNYEKPTEASPNLLPNSSALLGLSGWKKVGTAAGLENHWGYSTSDPTQGSYFYTNAVIGEGIYSSLESSAIVVNSNSWIRFQGTFHTLGTTDGLVYIEVVDVLKDVIIGTQHQLQLNKYWYSSGFDMLIPEGVTQIKIRLVTTGNSKTEWRCFSRMKLAYISSSKNKFLEYSNEADITVMKNYTDLLPWQKIKMTADNGASIDISNQDLNAYRHTGFYMGSQLTNAPDNNTGDWWFIQQIVHNSEYVIQNAYPLSNGDMANGMRQRRKVAGVWKPWSADLFQSVSSGKASIETAITGKGGTVSKAGSVAAFSELVAGVNSIQQSVYVASEPYINKDIEVPRTGGVAIWSVVDTIMTFPAKTKVVSVVAGALNATDNYVSYFYLYTWNTSQMYMKYGLRDKNGLIWAMPQSTNGYSHMYISSLIFDYVTGKMTWNYRLGNVNIWYANTTTNKPAGFTNDGPLELVAMAANNYSGNVTAGISARYAYITGN